LAILASTSCPDLWTDSHSGMVNSSPDTSARNRVQGIFVPNHGRL
jgi:hypothetical protein